MRVVAEEVGWFTHTSTFEDVSRKLKGRFPFLARVGASYGKGAREESARRSGQGQGIKAMGGSGGGEAVKTKNVRGESDGDDGGMEEVSLEDAEDDEWHSVEGEASMIEAKGN